MVFVGRNWTNNLPFYRCLLHLIFNIFFDFQTEFPFVFALSVGNNFFLITFVKVVLYFDLYCLSSSVTLLVVALSKLYFSNIFRNFAFCCILFTGNNFKCSKLTSWHLAQLYMVRLDFSLNSSFFHF